MKRTDLYTSLASYKPVEKQEHRDEATAAKRIERTSEFIAAMLQQARKRKQRKREGK